jgi:D-alanyl-D-alanine carboxypeptidase
MSKHIPIAILQELGIALDPILARGLPACREAQELVLADVAKDGREFLLIPEVAAAWLRMKEAAAREGETLAIVSAFRSVARQTELIREKLATGASLEDTMVLCAPPGFSEHHTGCAVDIGSRTPGAYGKKFDQTTAYLWLRSRAVEFGFRMSYPVGNPFFQYEPWHWCHEAAYRDD